MSSKIYDYDSICNSILSIDPKIRFAGVINEGGRLISGRLADKFGALNVYRTMYFVTIISLFFLSFVQVKPVAIVALLFISIGYGSFLSLVPTITGKLFGIEVSV